MCSLVNAMPTQPVVNDDQIWIDRFQRWGLSAVAPMLLDVLRPLGLVGSQMIIMAKPVLTSFVSAAQIDQFTDLIEDPDRLARLRQALEAEVKVA
jgi:acyl carrier protein phosphodiesterase